MINFMRRLMILSILLGAVPFSSQAGQKWTYPAAQREAVQEARFDRTLEDPYRWLESSDSPETQTWIQAENRLSEQYFSQGRVRDSLQKRLTQLLDVDQVHPPQSAGKRLFYK